MLVTCTARCLLDHRSVPFPMKETAIIVIATKKLPKLAVGQRRASHDRIHSSPASTGAVRAKTTPFKERAAAPRVCCRRPKCRTPRAMSWRPRRAASAADLIGQKVSVRRASERTDALLESSESPIVNHFTIYVQQHCCTLKVRRCMFRRIT